VGEKTEVRCLNSLQSRLAFLTSSSSHYPDSNDTPPPTAWTVSTNDAMAQPVDHQDNDLEYQLDRYKVLLVFANTLGRTEIRFIFIDSRGIGKKTGDKFCIGNNPSGGTTELRIQDSLHPFQSDPENTIQLVGWVQRNNYKEAVSSVCRAVHEAMPNSCCHVWTSEVIARLASAGVLEGPRPSDDTESMGSAAPGWWKLKREVTVTATGPDRVGWADWAGGAQ
jgi:hypothetical protein